MDKLIYTAFQSINNALDNKAIRSQNLSSTNTPGFRADMSVGSAGSGYLEQFDTLYSRAFPVIDDRSGWNTAIFSSYFSIVRFNQGLFAAKR